MKKLLPLIILLAVLLYSLPALAQDTTRVYDYALLSRLPTNADGSKGKFMIQYSNNTVEDISAKLGLPSKMFYQQGYSTVIDNGKISEYNSSLFKCFNYLNGKGYELVSFSRDEYIFKKPYKKP